MPLNNKKTILLNGAIRDSEEFYLILDFILFQIDNAKKSVDVIVSTWQQDINTNKQLVDHFKNKGVRFIAVPDLDEGGPANIYRQWRTIEAGLNYIDADAVVLKGRTDKFLLRKDIIYAFIQDDFTDEVASFLDNDTLAVEHITISLPFMAKDMIFLGTVKAIRKILHYSLRTKYIADHIFNGIGPECFLWLELASNDQYTMQIVQKIDFRQISNKILDENLLEDEHDIDNNIVYLYHKWIEVFDKELCFLTDVLKCNKKQSWIIDEGTWRYKIGDRDEYEKLKSIIAHKEYFPPDLYKAKNLNGSYEYLENKEADYSFPFDEMQNQFYTDFSPEMSDIVLIRQKIINHELSKNNPDTEKLSKAIHWNIRQRDRGTLHMVYEWLMASSEEVRYVQYKDQVFTVERIVDFFTFSNDQEAIDATIEKLKYIFKYTPLLQTRVAEYYFKKQKLFKALYWFYLAYIQDSNSLGINHGLGCTLLDLKFPRLAVHFLKKAHRIAPFDQTAIFTLFRANVEIKKLNEAKRLKALLHGNLLIEAEKFKL